MSSIRERVAGLAATRAWSHAVEPTRLSRGARASLEQYAALVRRFRVLVAVVLAQGVLGGVQYAVGVPEVLVVLHVLGAGLVTAAAATLWFGTVARTGAPVDTRDARPALTGP